MKQIAILLLLLCSTQSFAQHQPKELFRKDNTHRRTVPTQYVREADVMWAKTIWRLVDLKQKFNHHLYFPTQPIGKYKSLTDVLFGLVKHQGLNIYDENQGDEFGLQLTNSDISDRMGGGIESIQVTEPLTGEMKIVDMRLSTSTTEVTRYLIKEIWFFDKSRSTMEVRIVGLCPVREYYHDDDLDLINPTFKKIGWFYFPEIIQHLANEPAMSSGGYGSLTYYDIFQSRYFESVIVQEGNTYDNRPISDYATGNEALLESKRIENRIRNFESDLWSQ